MDTPKSWPAHRKGNLVRPYTLTSGRTDTSIDLPLAHRWPPNDPRGRIIQLCVEHPSVAEISARLDLPLGVARVLVGDLVLSGYLRVHRTLSERSSTDERQELIGRTLRGLRAL